MPVWQSDGMGSDGLKTYQCTRPDAVTLSIGMILAASNLRVEVPPR